MADAGTRCACGRYTLAEVPVLHACGEVPPEHRHATPPALVAERCACPCHRYKEGCDCCPAPVAETRTERIRREQRSGTGKVTAVMVSRAACDCGYEIGDREVHAINCASLAPAPVAGGAFAQIERDGHFAEELTKLLNRYSQENASNTPDFILCNYIVACLAAFNEASRAREIWHGKSLHI